VVWVVVEESGDLVEAQNLLQMNLRRDFGRGHMERLGKPVRKGKKQRTRKSILVAASASPGLIGVLP